MFLQFNPPNKPPKDVAAVFVHGFTGDCRGTWGNIPELLFNEPALAGWDFFGFGYTSERRIDILHIWSSDASLEQISTMLVTVPTIKSYKRIALIAHSMGGLVVQRALLKSDDLRSKCSHLLLFGTPSAGLGKAGFVAALKQQIRDMNASGQFIGQLRSDWKQRDLDTNPPFRFVAVAGENDQFVPPDSSLGPFPEKYQAVIPGNHITMLRTDLQEPPPITTLIKAMLTDGAAPAGPRNSAALAVERGNFQQAIDKFWPIRNELDNAGAASLAIALDSMNRRDDAIALLQARGSNDTDSLGILAGRYKRRWLLEHRQADLDSSFELYNKAYQGAVAKTPPDSSQAYYHGINIGYLHLAERRLMDARAMATQVLAHCEEDAKINQRDIFWRLASQGDAHTILGQKDLALAAHALAAKERMDPWQALSIEEQAARIADLCGWSADEQNKLSSLYSS